MAGSRTRCLPLGPPTSKRVAFMLVAGFMLAGLPLAALARPASAMQKAAGESPLTLREASESGGEGAEGAAQARGSRPRFWLRSAFRYQELSFTSNAPGAHLTFGLERPREWTAWAGLNYVDKFGSSVVGYRMGGSYWAGARTVLSLDIDLAPEQPVLPRQAYGIEISHIYATGLVPSLRYRFADYSTANAHSIVPGFTWYLRRFYWVARYYLVVSQFGGQDFTTHSGQARAHWNVAGPVTLFAGYARSNESFESGNPAAPFAAFSADHLLSGLSWDIHERLGVRFAFDHESRNNGSTLRTYDIEMSYRR